MHVLVLANGSTTGLGVGFHDLEVVEQATRRGHRLWLYQDRQDERELHTQGPVERLRGDRVCDLRALRQGTWDVVFDLSAREPGDLIRALTTLRGRFGRYLCVAPASVPGRRPGRETAAFARRALEEHCADQSLLVHTATVLDARDPSGASSYWPRRLVRGGEVLAPGDPRDPLHFVDGRDLARTLLDLAEAGVRGAVHIDGPEHPLSLGEFLSLCHGALGWPSVALTWVSSEFLRAQGVMPGRDLPLWQPAAPRLASEPASAMPELRRRSPSETAIWLARRGLRPDQPSAGRGAAQLSVARERELLELWHGLAWRGGEASFREL